MSLTLNSIPCAATSSLFIYAYKESILLCKHGSLEIESIFTGHQDMVVFLAIAEFSNDTPVASYDKSGRLILWDMSTCEEMYAKTQLKLTSIVWTSESCVVAGLFRDHRSSPCSANFIKR